MTQSGKTGNLSEIKDYQWTNLVHFDLPCVTFEIKIENIFLYILVTVRNFRVRGL